MTMRLSNEQQQMMVAEIIKFFFKERHEEITQMEAEIVLEFIKSRLASSFYNAALHDVQYILEQQYCKLEDEILSLGHPLKKHLISETN